MKFFHKAYLTLSLCLLCSLAAFAQPGALGTIKNNGEGQGVVRLITPDQCEVTIPLAVRLTNLAYNGNEFILPPGHPPMYAEYTISIAPYTANIGPAVYGPLTEFEADGTINGILSYMAYFDTHTIDIQDFCQESTSGEVYASVHLRLVELVDVNGADTYIDYPVCDYTGLYDIFSCAVFEHAGDCPGDTPISQEDGFTNPKGDQKNTNKSRAANDDSINKVGPTGPPREPCNAQHLRSTSLHYKITCPEACGGQEPGPHDEPNWGRQERIQGNNGDINANLTDLSVYPNPASDQINVQLPLDEPLEGLKLYGSNGNLVKSWSKKELATSNLLELSTNDLPQGIYFFEAKWANDTKVIKVVKQ